MNPAESYRDQYRAQLKSFSDEELIQACLSVWRDLRYEGERPSVRLWGEYCDITAECQARGNLLQQARQRLAEQQERLTRIPTRTEHHERPDNDQPGPGAGG